MVGALQQLFGTAGFMPHGHCYLWKPALVWLHVVSDALIGVAYVAISITLTVLVRRIRDIPFNWMFLAFGAFIIACGATHFLEIWTVWNPTYWLAGDVKAVTALASVVTALLLPPLVPQAVGIAERAAVSEERRRQLEAAHEELQRLYGRVKEVDQLKTQFFANVSHELRTPLTLVLGPVEKLLAGGGLDQAQRDDLAVASRNARSLLRHVDELLDVAKLEAGRVAARYARVDLARLLRLVASHFDAVAAERPLRFVVDAPETLPAEVDPRQIERVVLNLLSNAFKFAPTGGTVCCLLRDEHGQALLTIEDDGPGVLPELRPAIFERFEQGAAIPSHRTGGTGLGLAIVKDFVELHGGTVGIEDRPGGGARFTVRLPLGAPAGASVEDSNHPAPATAGEAIRQAIEELATGTRTGTAVAPAGDDRPLVLVVEDNPDMSRFIAGVLEPTYRIAAAFDGQEALEQVRTLRPDVILSDVMMPQLSGDAFVGAVRQNPELSDVPIVMLTAKADDELRVRLLRGGAQDYVMKPFAAEELRARVANQATLKRTREVLQRELASQSTDIETLVSEVAIRKHELQAALETAQVARDHAERASETKSDFLRLVSHELRTPLTAMRIYLHLLEEDREGLVPKHRSVVAKISRSSARLLTLIESLLEYARLETGRLVISREPVDVAAVATEVVDDLRPHAEEKDLTLRAAVAPGLPPVTTDARLVRLILANLIGNAIKFTSAGSVDLTLGYEGGAYVFAVADSGPGIPADQQQAIFEPFHQLEPLKHKHTPGTGLGLALVRQMVEVIGGRITLRSVPGAGSTFSLVLPAGDPSVAHASA